MNNAGKYGETYKTETVNTSSDYRSSPPKQSKMKTHMRKYWWLHLISFILGTILVTLLLIFVGLPNISQNGINSSTLDLNSQIVTNPQPNSVHINMTTTSKSKNIFHPWLDEFKAALFLENTINGSEIKPFGYITIPRIKANAESTIVVDQTLEIADQEQFAAYNQLVLLSESYRVAVRGRTGLKEGSFPKVNVNFNKVITSKGLNNLKGFRVNNITISLVPEADGTNMHGTVFIPNPSPMTIDMGTIVQNVFVGEQLIGYTTIPKLVLHPGDNFVPMVTNSNQAAVISLITSTYKDGNVPVTIKGNSSSVNGVQLPYFTKALQAQVLQTTLNLGPALKAIGLDISAFGGGSQTTSSPSTSAGPATVSASSAVKLGA